MEWICLSTSFDSEWSYLALAWARGEGVLLWPSHHEPWDNHWLLSRGTRKPQRDQSRSGGAVASALCTSNGTRGPNPRPWFHDPWTPQLGFLQAGGGPAGGTVASAQTREVRRSEVGFRHGQERCPCHPCLATRGDSPFLPSRHTTSAGDGLPFNLKISKFCCTAANVNRPLPSTCPPGARRGRHEKALKHNSKLLSPPASTGGSARSLKGPTVHLP